jgi:transposase
VRKPFREHLPRERVLIEVPTSCTCRGSDRIVKMGEDITETLERHSAPVEGVPDGAPAWR